MTIRIAFAGASGTGKTTLATALAKEHSLPFCPVGSRSVAQSMGFENPYDVDAAGKRDEFQQLLVHRKSDWEREHLAHGFVTDRTHLDNLAYTCGHAPKLAIDGGFRLEVAIAMRVYTHVIFCPIFAYHNVDSDPSRVDDDDYHRKYEDVLVSLFGSFMRGPPILWLTSSDPEVRIAQVRRFVW
jgi:hypothetical protein